MAWIDRIREAAYTSPSGVRLVFDYEDVSQSFEKKTAAFEFPDANGTYVQDLGRSGRRLPLRVIFHGTNYDQTAAVFEAMLGEAGIGKLEHPIYGVIDVIPTGLVTRNDSLKTAANQAVIEVTFWETISLIYPTGQVDPSSALIAAVDAFNISAANSFGDLVALGTVTEQVTFKNQFKALVDNAAAGLQTIADTKDDVKAQFDAINDSIDQGLDVLVEEPITLALQTIQLVQAPARASEAIAARLDGYNNLINDITGANGIADNNAFYSADLNVMAYVTGSILSVVNNEFSTKPEAIAAADEILDQFDAITVWRDNNEPGIDTGEAYQKLQEAVALAAGFLVQISFTLKQERRLVLERARTIIDLAAELYGEIDPVLDFIIESNNLTGSEIIELPKGREIAYYI